MRDTSVDDVHSQPRWPTERKSQPHTGTTRGRAALALLAIPLFAACLTGSVRAVVAEDGSMPSRLPLVVPPTRLPLAETPIPETPFQIEPFARAVESARSRLSETPSSRITPAPAGSSAIASATPVTPHRRDKFDAAIRGAVTRATLLPPISDRISMPDAVPATEFRLGAFRSAIESALASSTSVPTIDPLASNASSCEPCQTKHDFYNDFSPTPVPDSAMIHDGDREAWVYDSKRAVPVQHPWIEWGRVFYGDGITPRGINWFGEKNMIRSAFYVYGDYRTGIASGRNAAGRTDNWAQRLNLDLDLKMTDTERFHMFVGPLDQDGRFTRWELVDGDLNYESEFDLNPLTGFFEGDLGVLMGTLQNRTSPMEIPFTVGLVPLLFQNGIWMEDAVTGAAFAIPARHSRLLNWSNYDATFFAAVDQINSPAFGADANAAQMLGTAWFIEAYGGYIEAGYAFLHDRNNDARSYHNMTASFTRRYFDRISNSVRVIVNTGQDLPDASRTADGALLLVENSWITANPLTFVPYMNLFVGWDRPQSVARAGVSGGILRNTGINFEIDGLNGFATLDATATDTAGGVIGVDLIGDDLDRQLLLELAYLTPHGSKNANVPDDQFAVGSRYQFPISHRTLLRFDAMYGWRRGLRDVYGTRMEYRWKF